MKLALWKVGALVCLMATSHAVAQDRCDSILDKGLKDEIEIRKDFDFKQAFAHEACSLSFKEFSERYGGSANVAYGLFSGGGDFNKENYEKWVNQSCEKSKSALSSTSLQYYKSSALNPKVYEEWSDCMTKRYGFNCWLKKFSPTVAHLTMSWQPIGAATFTVNKNSITLTNTKLSPVPEEPLNRGQTIYTLTRDNPREIATLTLNGTGSEQDFPCGVAILPEIGREVDIIETNSKLLHLEDINCYQHGKAPCDFWVTWAAPEPGMQVIIRAGENNAGYFACGGAQRKLASWGPEKLSYFQVPAINVPAPPDKPEEAVVNGCTSKMPQGAPLAESILKFRQP